MRLPLGYGVLSLLVFQYVQSSVSLRGLERRQSPGEKDDRSSDHPLGQEKDQPNDTHHKIYHHITKKHEVYRRQRVAAHDAEGNAGTEVANLADVPQWAHLRDRAIALSRGDHEAILDDRYHQYLEIQTPYFAHLRHARKASAQAQKKEQSAYDLAQAMHQHWGMPPPRYPPPPPPSHHRTRHLPKGAWDPFSPAFFRPHWNPLVRSLSAPVPGHRPSAGPVVDAAHRHYLDQIRDGRMRTHLQFANFLRKLERPARMRGPWPREHQRQRVLHRAALQQYFRPTAVRATFRRAVEGSRMPDRMAWWRDDPHGALVAEARLRRALSEPDSTTMEAWRRAA